MKPEGITTEQWIYKLQSHLAAGARVQEALVTVSALVDVIVNDPARLTPVFDRAMENALEEYAITLRNACWFIDEVGIDPGWRLVEDHDPEEEDDDEEESMEDKRAGIEALVKHMETLAEKEKAQ